MEIYDFSLYFYADQYIKMTFHIIKNFGDIFKGLIAKKKKIGWLDACDYRLVKSVDPYRPILHQVAKMDINNIL